MLAVVEADAKAVVGKSGDCTVLYVSLNKVFRVKFTEEDTISSTIRETVPFWHLLLQADGRGGGYANK